MRVMITGGTGYIGGAVLDALVADAHDVVATIHDEALRGAIAARGARPALGDLRDVATLAVLAREADAVIHAANTNDADAAAVDTAAVRAFLGALGGTGRPFVYTSGAWVLGATGDRGADELTTPHPIPLVAWRADLEQEVVRANGVRGIVVRPGIVFGEDGGIPAKLARGELPVVGDGAQRMPLVHVRDLADLYVRALAAPAGAILHGVAMTRTARDVASGSEHALPADPLPLAAARERLGAFADALALDQVIASDRTRALVGWAPVRTREAVEAGSRRAALSSAGLPPRTERLTGPDDRSA